MIVETFYDYPVDKSPLIKQFGESNVEKLTGDYTSMRKKEVTSRELNTYLSNLLFNYGDDLKMY